jgi:hypothetical protein
MIDNVDFVLNNAYGSSQPPAENEYSAAKAQHDKMCINAAGLKSFEQSTEFDLCDKERFSMYAEYLLKYAKSGTSKGEDKDVTMYTALQYLSGFKEAVRRKFPTNPLWTADEKGQIKWYHDLRTKLSSDLKRKCIVKAKPILNK